MTHTLTTEFGYHKTTLTLFYLLSRFFNCPFTPQILLSEQQENQTDDFKQSKR